MIEPSLPILRLVRNHPVKHKEKVRCKPDELAYDQIGLVRMITLRSVGSDIHIVIRLHMLQKFRIQKSALPAVIRQWKIRVLNRCRTAPIFRQHLAGHLDGHGIMSDCTCIVIWKVPAWLRTGAGVKRTITVPVDYEMVVIVMLVILWHTTADKHHIGVVISCSRAHTKLSHSLKIDGFLPGLLHSLLL